MISKTALDKITDIPSNLDEVYENILRKSTDRLKATKLLQIVVAATRPLSLKDINIAFTISPQDCSEEEISLEPSIGSTAKDLCGLFVRVIESKVFLIHQTAREFLIKLPGDLETGSASSITSHAGSDQQPKPWKSSLCELECNLILVNSCMQYLLFAVFDVDHVRKSDSESKKRTKENSLEKHGFLDYAATQWAFHYRTAHSITNSVALTMALRIFDTNSGRSRTCFGSTGKEILSPNRGTGLC
jgi:hypothetical protein